LPPHIDTDIGCIKSAHEPMVMRLTKLRTNR